MTSSASPPGLFAPRSAGGWLFGAFTDLTVFGGSAALSALLLVVGWRLGILHAEAPVWVWWSCVLCVDVAHVWSSLFRVYFDHDALRERPLLYTCVPMLAYAAGVVITAFGPALFWRLLAYIAVFHFVRQQVGFVALYDYRDGGVSRWEGWLDRATVYAVTLHPIVVWHTRLPQPFAWFLAGDFVPGLPSFVARITGATMWLLLTVFILRQAIRFARGTSQPGKMLIVLTTFACWYGGIVVLASDFAFTVTNILIHGVPYMLLTYRYARARREQPSISAQILRFGVPGFIAVCVGLAWLEESAWDRFIWHEHAEWFGSASELSSPVLLWLLPLLALPQLTHYLLDGWVWRVREERSVLRRELEGA